VLITTRTALADFLPSLRIACGTSAAYLAVEFVAKLCPLSPEKIFKTPSKTVKCSVAPFAWGLETSAPPGAMLSSYHSMAPAVCVGLKMRNTQRPSGVRISGIRLPAIVSMTGRPRLDCIAMRSENSTSSARVKFHSVAKVGFASPLSICESIDFETPEREASSSSDRCCRLRIA
jgi:hypothetical protein